MQVSRTICFSNQTIRACLSPRLHIEGMISCLLLGFDLGALMFVA